ncbi:MAG: NAD(P)/FAD-dependent oxidoreductase [Acidobacteriota bacterium]
MSRSKVDAIVIGGGHNGLIAAGYLAKAGLKVTVLEKRSIVGGACVTEEIAPGFRVSRTSYVSSLMLPEVIRDFRMVERGYEVMIPDPSSFWVYPDGRYFLTHRADPVKQREEISKFSKKDVGAFERFDQDLMRLRPLLDDIMRTTPPKFPPVGIKDYWSYLRLGRKVQALGKKDMRHFMELMMASSAEYLDKRFESTEMKATIATSGTVGTGVGVMTPGSAYVILHHVMGGVNGIPGAWGYVRGGMGSITKVLAEACKEWGVEIRTDSQVEKVLVRNGRASGVVLKNGDELQSRMVVSNADPKRTYLGFVDSEHLDPEFLEDIRKFKIQGTSIKVNCALSELPDWKCLPGKDPAAPHHQAMFAIAPSMDYLEEAFDDMKYGRPSRRPIIDGNIASVMDDSLAPKGKHVMSLFVQYAPYHLKEGTWPEIREKVADVIIDTIAEYAPNIKSAIIARDVLSPWDLEQQYGLTEGNIFHGEITPDQIFFMRPAPGWAHYRCPLRGLYLCGSGAHPGGGVMGGPGMNASREILRDLREL